MTFDLNDKPNHMAQLCHMAYGTNDSNKLISRRSYERYCEMNLEILDSVLQLRTNRF